MRAPLVLLLALAACGGPLSDDAGGEADLRPQRHLFSLQNAPFGGAQPSVLVHLGKGFTADGPLNLVVHYHGWANCIENDGEATGAACTRGGPVRVAHDLIGQLDRSGVDAALILVERAFDQSSSDDGKLAQAGVFRAMILELLPRIGALAGRNYTEQDLGALVLSSHSGGYRALAHTLDRGGLTPHVRQVILLDSVYDNVAQFEAWASAAPGQNRLAVVYTDGAGTKPLSQKLASDARSWGAPVVDDRTFATLTDAAFAAPLLFKRSALSHDGTAQYYFGRLLAHAF